MSATNGNNAHFSLNDDDDFLAEFLPPPPDYEVDPEEDKDWIPPSDDYIIKLWAFFGFPPPQDLPSQRKAIKSTDGNIAAASTVDSNEATSSMDPQLSTNNSPLTNPQTVTSTNLPDTKPLKRKRKAQVDNQRTVVIKRVKKSKNQALSPIKEETPLEEGIYSKENLPILRLVAPKKPAWPIQNTLNEQK